MTTLLTRAKTVPKAGSPVSAAGFAGAALPAAFGAETNVPGKRF